MSEPGAVNKMLVKDLSLLLNLAFFLCSDAHQRLLTGALCPLDRYLSLEGRAQQMCLVQHILHCISLAVWLVLKGGVTCLSLHYCFLLFNPLDPDTPIKSSRLVGMF